MKHWNNNKRDFMKLVWFALSLIPIPFLFHFYEYGQYNKRKRSSISYVWFHTFYDYSWNFIKEYQGHFYSFNELSDNACICYSRCKVSSNDSGWFTVVGRDGAVIFICLDNCL
ncbi:hypothetical protein [Parageobacillus thermoglucosidasius]|uniref:Uncharacterized protein n=1 Tax=Parageobacillus thermoglucosidasius TaxID=1426 RepID=A0AAN0YM48_PARTM|nr:hypothetical protein [Parageobacillus thermoglucosidasius]ALF09623.1 hypothetical protein AOT13_06240 [Parageobacillus thermoglucosidasius]ANZ29705.1 hypothetical protein BCV53_06245 [Parageobacillus thermoglucosidasius]APM80443.1 hypothetical protein BCV54_06250 [Parageobacillus thermoglucosidasius]KJX67378.1 hypothetical protein WH82_18015 [Parageobacillus thermoglucosidasius]RDE21022.1 hypothetical protein DV712_12780 [Parageobacillus thermoglucosidasius]